MKKLIIISLVALLALSLFALDNSEMDAQEARNDAMEIATDAQEVANEALQEVSEALQEIEDETGFSINIDMIDVNSNGAYLGVFHADLDLEKMQELGYDKRYGVLITGVSPGTAADLFRLAKDDIIMQIGEYEVKNGKDFGKVLKLFRAGDEVKMKIFRFNAEKEIDFVFGSRSSQIALEGGKVIFLSGKNSKNEAGSKKKKLSGGSGGGSWIPVWFHTDLTDINKFMLDNDLNEISELEMLDKSGILMQGGGGKGNIGKNWMLGGMGAGFTYEASNELPNNAGIRKVTYELGFGGVTLDRRIPITKKIVLATGFMLGGAHQNIIISETDGSFNWANPHSSNDSGKIFQMGKTYIIFQPKVAGMYRILDWLSIRAEAGYMLSHSFSSGWKADFAEEDYDVSGSPDTELEGFTFTIGPWFGF